MNIKLVDDKPEILHELRRRINSYKKLHPNLTSQQISKRFGMSNSTFHRIENMELRKPTFDQIVKVLKGVGADKDLVQLLTANYPDIMDSIQSTVEESLEKDRMSNDVIDMMGDDVYGKIMRFIRSDSVSEDEITKEFGEDGLRKAEWLYLNGYIKKAGEKSFVGLKVRKVSSFQSIKRVVIKALEQDYNTTGAENKTALNFLSYTSGAADAKKVLPLISYELDKARSRIKDIMDDEENAGTDRIWFSLAADNVLHNETMEL